MQVKVAENNVHKDAIRYRIAISIQLIGGIFAPAFTVSKMLTFQNCVFENLSHGHEVQHSKWRRSMGMLKSIIVISCFFCILR